MQVSDEKELSAAIAQAKGPLRIKGGGTRELGHRGEPLDVTALSGITLYEPGALTIVARAGTPVTEIEATLASEGQCLPFEPNFPTAGPSTIGGVVATNASGPRRVQVGAARDFCLGVQFVDGMGRVIKNGGRVMKNVTGYDLVKLMAGSWGQLGAISEVSLKVLPKPETETTLKLRTRDIARAVKAMSAALGSPYEVSGAAHGKGMDDEDAIFIRVEGFEASVGYRAEKLAELLAAFGAVETVKNNDGSSEIWQTIRNLNRFREKDYVARVSIKPSALPELLEGFAARFGMPDAQQGGYEVMLDWGGGLAWIAADAAALAHYAKTAPEPGSGEIAIGAQNVHEYLQNQCAQGHGHTTLVRAPDGALDRVSIFQPETAGVAALTQGLQAKFDPKGLFSRSELGASK